MRVCLRNNNTILPRNSEKMSCPNFTLLITMSLGGRNLLICSMTFALYVGTFYLCRSGRDSHPFPLTFAFAAAVLTDRAGTSGSTTASPTTSPARARAGYTAIVGVRSTSANNFFALNHDEEATAEAATAEPDCSLASPSDHRDSR